VVVLDPRELIIYDRLRSVNRKIAILSPKGGVGKTLISLALALSLSLKNRRVGFLDLDLTNPTAHIALGVNVKDLKPKEEKGLIPPEIKGIKFMSIAYYNLDEPLPLRGHEIVNVIKELLAITIWGDLDYLIIDTPPGLSDEVLSVLKYFKEVETLLVTTPSPLALRSVERLIKMLIDAKIKILGIVENMVLEGSRSNLIASRYGLRVLSYIPYISNLDHWLGDAEKFVKSPLMEYVNTLRSYIDRG